MVIIQCNDNGKPFIHECSSIYFGLSDSALLDCMWTHYRFLSAMPYSQLKKATAIFGTVEFMTKAFEILGKEYPTIPKPFDRPYRIGTLGEAIEESKSRPIFIKPMKVKQFQGLVLDGFRYSCLEGVPLDSKVYIAEPFKNGIVSEWRCYISGKRVEFAGNYSGDFSTMPDLSVAWESASENYGTFPCAYSIDLALLEDGSTEIIEYNDFFALGNYGMPNRDYTRLALERYDEYIKQ